MKKQIATGLLHVSEKLATIAETLLKDEIKAAKERSNKPEKQKNNES